MTRATRQAITLFFLPLALLVNSNAIGEEVMFKGKTWHVIPGAATSTSIFIEKSTDPRFGKKHGRKQKKREKSEEFILLKPFNGTATSTPFSIEEIYDDDHVIQPLSFDFSVINNTCSINKFPSATFDICNEDLFDIEVLGLVPVTFADILSPLLPVVVKADACTKINIIGNNKIPFDCSGNYAVSFGAKMAGSEYTGYFGASIIE